MTSTNIQQGDLQKLACVISDVIHAVEGCNNLYILGINHIKNHPDMSLDYDKYDEYSKKIRLPGLIGTQRFVKHFRDIPHYEEMYDLDVWAAQLHRRIIRARNSIIEFRDFPNLEERIHDHISWLFKFELEDYAVDHIDDALNHLDFAIQKFDTVTKDILSRLEHLPSRLPLVALF
jgi:hypothetical protein